VFTNDYDGLLMGAFSTEKLAKDHIAKWCGRRADYLIEEHTLDDPEKHMRTIE